ncbi:hypothetical protein HY643_00490 [Candidatus Woesearchaeota archaeon]|nr:hypothetical protein [Candidatus Woesearchaeota archaeon]
MAWIKYLLYFITGGIITTAIVALEESGMPLLSRLAALFPVFTWISYLFIGQFGSAQQVANHARFVLIGTIVSWTPYMISIIYFAPKIGVYKSIAVSILIFVIAALIFSYAYFKF